jgi:cytochrome bd-type quinol oxidase subunit 1
VSKLSLMLMAVTIILGVVCVLLIIFMVANDRHADQPQWFHRIRSLGGGLWFGLFAIFGGCYWASVARDADRRHTVITSPDIGWMTPTHGYAAAGLVVLMGLYSIFLWMRERRASNSNTTRRI